MTTKDKWIFAGMVAAVALIWWDGRSKRSAVKKMKDQELGRLPMGAIAVAQVPASYLAQSFPVEIPPSATQGMSPLLESGYPRASI